MKPAVAKKISVFITICSIAALVLIPLFSVIRGIDLTDTGFVLTNHHFFSPIPSMLRTGFICI